MWIFMILSIILIGVGIKLTKEYYEFLGLMVTVLMIGFLLVTTLFWIGMNYDSKTMIITYPTFVQTIESARHEDISDYERMALTQEILEFNLQLQKAQYWNSTFMFDMFYLDGIMELEPIR